MRAELANTVADPRPRGDLAGLLLIGAQLAGLVLLIHLLRLETEAVRQVARLALAGLAVHALLPGRWRLAGFAALSLAAVGLVLGWRDGAWLVGAGLLLIGICHLPWRLGARAGLLLAAGSALAWLRSLPVGTASPWSAAVWPVLGSMFMFRLIVYLYDLEHEPVRPRLARSLSYFFMLPNVCFPLFPVVDYKSFRAGYRADPPLALRQRGVDWMLRGVLHLLVYRLVYNHLLLSPGEVASFAGLIQFLVANILLYVRVSGQFHLIVGMLCLFGFDLPESNRLYFLAASFNDYWRRINIYWKEFMLKVVYWPAFLGLKRLGKFPAMALATLLVFLASWLLHSYQWFWLQGRFPLRAPDALFWGTVGLLVLANSLVESRRKRRRSLGGRQWTAAAGAASALRTLATFSAITVLWSLWTSDSLGEWRAVWQDAAAVTEARDLMALLLAVAAVAALGATAGWIAGCRPGVWASLRRPGAALSTAVIGALCIVTLSSNRYLGPRASAVLADLRETRLSSRDEERLVHGYYEGLLSPTRLESEVATRAIAEPATAADPTESGNFKRRNDFLWVDIRPRRNATYLGQPFRSNRWGMRDREYEKRRPAGTRRIALLGSSQTMGHGVGNDDTFDTLLEDRLNRAGLGEGAVPFEVLNFAVDSHSLLQQLMVLEERVFDFDPQVVLYVAHVSEAQWVRRHLIRVVATELDARYPFLEDILERAGAVKGLGWNALSRRVRPVQREVMAWAYERFVEACRERGAVPVWVLLPRLEEFGQDRNQANLLALTTEAGFRTARLAGLYDGRETRDLAVSATDLHLNADGNRLVADALYAHLRENATVWGLVAGPGGAARRESEAGDAR